jgi:molybdopterin-binding protein
MCQVEVQSGDNHIVAVITTEAADEMGLHEGMAVIAMFKSTSVMLATRTSDAGGA